MSLSALDAPASSHLCVPDTLSTPSAKSLASSASSSTHSIDHDDYPVKFGALKLYEDLVASVRTSSMGKVRRGSRTFSGRALIDHVQAFLNTYEDEQYHDATPVHAQRVAMMLLTSHVIEPVKTARRPSFDISSSKRCMYRLCDPDQQGSPAPLRSSLTLAKPT
eukprot:TRINITY_DN2550_c0_g1_i1.p1 TRINITY_DN2550_c0_g1~~TRINITY_DN2550_c0_g1_i1.p1  ORF type:complete len:164 (+),score=17.22 TRINITY_DN2550_c0_g1_i1:180-671(+)